VSGVLSSTVTGYSAGSKAYDPLVYTSLIFAQRIADRGDVPPGIVKCRMRDERALGLYGNDPSGAIGQAYTIWTMVFQGKNVVVTGGANGIGFAISRNIVAAGGAVWIFDVDSENPAAVAQDIGAQACVLQTLRTVHPWSVHSIRSRSLMSSW
jgi:hypothetical protein